MAAMGGGAAGSATADAMAGRGEPRRRPDRRRRATARDDGGGRPQRADLREDEGDDGTLLSAAAGTQLGRKMGLGLDGDAAPRSRSMLPGAAQRRRRVEDRIEPYSSDTMLRIGMETEMLDVLDSPKWGIYST